MVHAGLSPQLVHSKVPTKLHLNPSSHSLNNNLLIALRPAKDAMEVGKHVPLSITKVTILKVKPAIHTLLLMVLALTMLPTPTPKLVLRTTSTLHPIQLMPSKLLLLNSPSPSLLRPINFASSFTNQVFSTTLTAEQLLITPSSLLVMVMKVAKTTGSSRTHGEPHGVKQATSRSLQSLAKVSAAFKKDPSTQPSDFDQY